MVHDFDNLVEMKMAEYDPARARDLLRALVGLCLDADRQRAICAEKKRNEALDRRMSTGYNMDTQDVSTSAEDTFNAENET